MSVDMLLDRTLDGKLEERWFGCTVVWRDDDEPFRVDTDPDTGISLDFPVPAYSQDIKATWSLAYAAAEQGLEVRLALTADATNVKVLWNGAMISESRATESPRAIAQALMLVPE